MLLEVLVREPLWSTLRGYYELKQSPHQDSNLVHETSYLQENWRRRGLLLDSRMRRKVNKKLMIHFFFDFGLTAF